MKIAIYSGVMPSTSFIERLVEGVSEAGHEVYLFGRMARPYRPKNDRIRVFSTPAGGWRMLLFVWWKSWQLRLRSPGDYRKLKQYIRENLSDLPRKRLLFRLGNYLPVLLHRPDVFHIQWVKSTDKWIFLKEWFDIPVVVSLRGSQINVDPVSEPDLPELYRQVFPKVDAFHAVSQAIAQNTLAMGVDPSRIIVASSGIPDAMLERPLPDHKIRKSGPLRIISVGRFHWIKGYPYGLDALRIVKDHHIPFQYTLIAGNPPEEILYQIHDLELENEVTVLRELPNSEVLQKMAESDILLLPSFSEGGPNVVLEAMAAGAMVVSTRCGGVTDEIEDGRTGFLAPVRDPKAMAEKIMEVAALSGPQRQVVAEAAREMIAQRFTLSYNVSVILSLYQSLLHAQGSREKDRVGAGQRAGIL